MKILKDDLYKNFLKNKNLSDSTRKNYTFALDKFCTYFNIEFHDLVHMLHEEQYDKIEGNRIIKFDVKYSTIAKMQTEYIEHLQNKGNLNRSIISHLISINAVLKYHNIQTPKLPDLENNSKKWYLLTKEDIKYCIDTSYIQYKAIYTLIASTGMRRTDIVKIKIGDFIKATQDYHNYHDVKEFIDHAPKNMIGFWSFYPQKTRKNNIQCKVCNTPEASNYIILMLRERQKLLNKNHPDVRLEWDDPLFANKYKQYKKPLSPASLSTAFHKKSKKLIKERKRVLADKYTKGELSEHEYNELLEEEPNFTPHNLRKFFISTAAENIGNLRICALMEGHAAPMNIDSHYVKINDDVIKEEYHKLIEPLSFENIEVNFITSKKRKELEQQIMELKEENKNIKENIDEEVDKAFMKTLEKYKKEIYSNIKGEVQSQKWD